MNRRALMRSSGAVAVTVLGASALKPSAAEAAGHASGGAHDHRGPIDPTGPTAGVTRTELQRHPSPTKGWETVQTLVRIPRGKESGRHSHPGVEVGYIVRGDVLMEFDDGPALRLRTGDPFFIPAGAIHNALNVGTVTTMMLSTYVVDETKPLVTTY
ncbi:cupin domain-containing protein [Streptomyces sp. AM 4-1-1]|uniref:cupin domain-containing protein n=1 Tax=Streptomyces sp. AM 4-1-1 TaxID=3028710 RepID=UPI0023B9132D|nr:cupin domain-containing protein [Streptomyces sp. AM 4-1-1]WEH36585.1 cupin domain-containing protein [Streptomyces sp. AM 4-1-1]